MENLIKYEYRASKFGELVSNPLNYFKSSKVKTGAMNQGITREPVSYELFEKVTGIKKYRAQQSAIYTTDEYVLEGTPDIVTKNAIYDIKNSKQSDDALISAYKYQLAVYKYLFFPDKKAKCYLFVDANPELETDVSKCRIIEVDVSDCDINLCLASITKALDNYATSYMNPKHSDDIEFVNKLTHLEELQKKQTELATEIKQLKKEIDIKFKQEGSIDFGVVKLLPQLKREVTYKRVATDWKGEYEVTWTLK